MLLSDEGRSLLVAIIEAVEEQSKENLLHCFASLSEIEADHLTCEEREYLTQILELLAVRARDNW